MTTISKKTAAAAKKPGADSPKAKGSSTGSDPAPVKSPKTQADSALTRRDAKDGATRGGASDRYVKSDVGSEGLVEKANDHMERAWGKIYGHRGKDGKAAA